MNDTSNETEYVAVTTKKIVKTEVSMKEVQVEDLNGDLATLEIYEKTSYIPSKYVALAGAGFMSDESGNLVDEKGDILTSKEKLATLINKIKNEEDASEEITEIFGVKVAEIYEKGEDLPTELADFEEEESPEEQIEEGEMNGWDCRCNVAPVCCEETRTRCCTRFVPTPVDTPQFYDVEVCEPVPVEKIVEVPVHVAVRVPVKVPVFVKEYTPNYIQKIIPVERKVYKEQI